MISFFPKLNDMLYLGSQAISLPGRRKPSAKLRCLYSIGKVSKDGSLSDHTSNDSTTTVLYHHGPQHSYSTKHAFCRLVYLLGRTLDSNCHILPLRGARNTEDASTLQQVLPELPRMPAGRQSATLAAVVQ